MDTVPKDKPFTRWQSPAGDTCAVNICESQGFPVYDCILKKSKRIRHIEFNLGEGSSKIAYQLSKVYIESYGSIVYAEDKEYLQMLGPDQGQVTS
jgi:hypothetical protein